MRKENEFFNTEIDAPKNELKELKWYMLHFMPSDGGGGASGGDGPGGEGESSGGGSDGGGDNDSDSASGLGAGAGNDAQAGENDAQSGAGVGMGGAGEGTYGGFNTSVAAANEALGALGLGPTGNAGKQAADAHAQAVIAASFKAYQAKQQRLSLATTIAKVLTGVFGFMGLATPAAVAGIAGKIAHSMQQNNVVDRVDPTSEESVANAVNETLSNDPEFAGVDINSGKGLESFSAYGNELLQQNPQYASELTGGLSESHPKAQSGDFGPYEQIGANNLQTYQSMLDGTYDYNESPAAKWALQEATKTQNRQDAARGLAGSGGASARLGELAGQIAANDYQAQYNRIKDSLGIGFNATKAASSRELADNTLQQGLTLQSNAQAAADRASEKALPLNIANTAVNFLDTDAGKSVWDAAMNWLDF